MRRRIWLLPHSDVLMERAFAQPAKLSTNQYFEEGLPPCHPFVVMRRYYREDLPEAKIRLAESYRFRATKASAQWYVLRSLSGEPP